MDCVPVLLIELIDTVDEVNPDVLDVMTEPTTRYGFVRPFVEELVPGLEYTYTVVELVEYVP